MSEIIQRLNDLFHGELSEQNKLVYVNDVLMGKLLESATLRQQGASNSKQQFATSPDLNTELLIAIISALDAHTAMSTQALNSPDVQRGLKVTVDVHGHLVPNANRAAVDKLDAVPTRIPDASVTERLVAASGGK